MDLHIIFSHHFKSYVVGCSGIYEETKRGKSVSMKIAQLINVPVIIMQQQFTILRVFKIVIQLYDYEIYNFSYYFHI